MSKHVVPERLTNHLQHYIGRKFVDPDGGKVFEVLDPLTA